MIGHFHLLYKESPYRKLFLDKYLNLPNRYQVYHTLPQKYAYIMEEVGINVHELQYLKGVDNKIHKLITKKWREWDKSLGRTPTAQEVIDFAKEIDLEYNQYWFNK